jgi:threonine dehydrogenase-like Zn-dependent dehydrogenase
MRAIALRRGASAVELIEVPRPELKEGQVLVRAIRSGVCGTDREMIQRQALDAPPGEDFLILGHEGFGEVVEVRGLSARGGREGDLKPGDLVVPIVRRGCGECNACNTGHPDYCYTGRHTERGLHREHGFFSEYYSDWPQYLVKVAPGLADIAVLAEPLSVSEKAYMVAMQVLDRVRFAGAYSQPGKAERALVAGHGPIGLLALLLLHSEGWETHVVGRRPEGDFQRELIESIGVRYLESGEEIDDFVKREEGFLLIFEATGLAEITFRLADYLGRNGVLVLTGVPRGPKEICLDANSLMAQLVRTNQAIIGSVNACAPCFSTALHRLAEFERRYPAFTSRLITSRFPPEQYAPAFAAKGKDEIKVVIEFGE